jgi:hypothetical protein
MYNILEHTRLTELQQRKDVTSGKQGNDVLKSGLVTIKAKFKMFIETSKLCMAFTAIL